MLLVALTGLASCSEDYAQPPLEHPEGGIGTGDWDNPMTAYQCCIGSVNPDHAVSWVTGYIVGVVNTEVGTVINERSAQFEAPFTTNTNLLIALTPEENDWEKCATVQLPSGSVRKALNLVDNADNLGKQVTIKGETGTKYCGAYGIRSASDFNWGDKGKEEVVLAPIDGPFFQNFEASTSFDTYESQGWKNVMVSGGLSGWYVRSFDNNNYITVSAYQGTQNGGPYENWLITPAIDMSKITQKTLEFVTQAAYAVDNSADCTLEVYVLTSDKPKVDAANKLPAVIAEAPASGYSSWVSSGKLDLSAYEGTIYIGWRYWSKQGGQGYSVTWCVDNVNVGGASEPDVPVTPPVSGDAVYEALQENATTCDWTFENIDLPAELTYNIWNWSEYEGTHYLKASAHMGDINLKSEAIAYSPMFSLAGVTGAYVEFEHAAKFQTTITSLCKFLIREKGATTWTEMDIPQWPEAGGWKFKSSGKIDISAFDGKEVQVGFKYASTTEGADTWEINNLKVNGAK